MGSDPLLLKLSHTGVTYLTQYEYRKRYIGSKKHAVAINGVLYLDKKELERVIEEEGKKFGVRPKKNRRTPKNSGENFEPSSKDTNDESTAGTDLSTIAPEISTEKKEKQKKQYRVNKREVRQRVMGYGNTVRGKKELYFWTVTFPAKTPDDLCYQIFNIWLTSLRKYRMLREYLWIAERQPKTTQTIHFHIAIPHRMCVYKANAMMQGTLKTFARRGVLPYSALACARYNGVHITKDKKTKRVVNFMEKKRQRALANYLTKYITKNDESFTHLAWHNSRGYSSVFTCCTLTVQEFRRHGMDYYLDRRNIFKMEFAVFIPWIHGPPPVFADHLFRLNSYIQEQLN